ENVLSTPPDTYLKLLEVQLDPVKSADLQQTIQVTLLELEGSELEGSDIKRSWGLHVRRGVAEVTEGAPATPDAAINMTHKTWAQIVAKEITLEDAIKSSAVSYT